MSVAATTLCLFCMVPPVILGVAAKTINWSSNSSVNQDTSLVLPAVVWQETPYVVSLLTLAAVR